MNENKPADDAHAQRRRRVLRGALSAPVVLTISNGAGAQMASSLRCVANQVNNPTSVPRTQAPSTAVPVNRVNVRLRLTGGKYYIRGSEVRALAHPNRQVTWIGNSEYREFVLASNSLTGLNVTLPAEPPVTNRWVVLQWDQHGYITSAGVNNLTPTPSSMITGTCWASFFAGP